MAADCSTDLKLGFGDFPISEAVDEVIVHHPDCLHVCINNGGTHEAESALFQVFAERIEFGGGRGNLLHDFISSGSLWVVRRQSAMRMHQNCRTPPELRETPARCVQPPRFSVGFE